MVKGQIVSNSHLGRSACGKDGGKKSERETESGDRMSMIGCPKESWDRLKNQGEAGMN